MEMKRRRECTEDEEMQRDEEMIPHKNLIHVHVWQVIFS